MLKMTNKLFRRERIRLLQKTEEAKKRGGVSASLFLEEEMNAVEDADCYFFYGSRFRPKGLLTVFFPEEGYAEITVAEFVPDAAMLSDLYLSALRECERVNVKQVNTVRNPVYGFDLRKIKDIRFSYEWSEYMLCIEMRELAAVQSNCKDATTELKKEEAPERDGTWRYVLLQNGREIAECRILSADGGGQCYLFGLRTKEEFRRTGKASLLLREIAKEYEENPGAVLRLQVSSKNEPAMKLYGKLGFRTEEEREYYKTEEC